MLSPCGRGEASELYAAVTTRRLRASAVGQPLAGSLRAVIRVTVDTNVFGEAKMARMSRAADGLDIELAPTTVSLRERPLETSEPQWIVRESAVWGESRWGEAVWEEPISETAILGESDSRFEAILLIISNGSFPKPGQRDDLSKGEHRQLRDAMILEAHAREGRDVLVSDDARAYIRDGRRERLEQLCETRVMTVEEFWEHAQALPRP
jgi:hypothetical protein